MLVVSDTSPLTALLQIGREDLLRQIFSEVFIPPAVEAELLRNHTRLPDWLEVRAPHDIPENIMAAELDPGETEALALALEIHAGMVLMDERLGRRAAGELGLKVTGLLGCLVLAKDAGFIATVSPVIKELQGIAGCWFDDALIAAILHATDELG